MKQERLHITVNGAVQEVRAQNLHQLMVTMGVDAYAGGVALAVNDRVVPRSRWQSVELTDGDEIEIVRATAGG